MTGDSQTARHVSQLRVRLCVDALAQCLQAISAGKFVRGVWWSGGAEDEGHSIPAVIMTKYQDLLHNAVAAAKLQQQLDAGDAEATAAASFLTQPGLVLSSIRKCQEHVAAIEKDSTNTASTVRCQQQLLHTALSASTSNLVMSRSISVIFNFIFRRPVTAVEMARLHECNDLLHARLPEHAYDVIALQVDPLARVKCPNPSERWRLTVHELKGAPGPTVVGLVNYDEAHSIARAWNNQQDLTTDQLAAARKPPPVALAPRAAGLAAGAALAWGCVRSRRVRNVTAVGAAVVGVSACCAVNFAIGCAEHMQKTKGKYCAAEEHM